MRGWGGRGVRRDDTRVCSVAVTQRSSQPRRGSEVPPERLVVDEDALEHAREVAVVLDGAVHGGAVVPVVVADDRFAHGTERRPEPLSESPLMVDADRPDFVARNALSCMLCHASGPAEFFDEVREFAATGHRGQRHRYDFMLLELRAFETGLSLARAAGAAGACTARQSAPGWPCLAERDTTWSYAGAGLVNLENEQSRYCVEGDRLSIEVTDIESGAPFLMLYQRRGL